MDIPIKSEPEDVKVHSLEFIDMKPFASISDANMVNTKVEQSSHNGTGAHNQGGEVPINKKTDELSFHSRKVLLKSFPQEGCSLETIKKYAAVYGYNVDMATEYFEKAAKDAQEFVYQECDSLSFNNITQWLKHFKSTGGSQQCNYEVAIALNAIANGEFQPGPMLMRGINLKAIYKFLSNALLGLPQTQLDEASATFLSNEFQNLIDEANTDEADDDVRNMKREIEGNLVYTDNRRLNSLDPLSVVTEELNQCYKNIDKNTRKISIRSLTFG